MIASIKVPGLPETKGSWRNIGRGRMKADNPREAAWAEAVGWAARTAMSGRAPVADRVVVEAEFRLPPPPNRTKKNLRDLDKLLRSALDALTGLVYVDDELVDRIVADKFVVARGPGLALRVARLDRAAAVGTTVVFPPGALEWLRSGERGISSDMIFSHLTGVPICGTRWTSPPHDPSDLRLCRSLLSAVPAFRARLGEMSAVNRRWAALVARWDQVCNAVDANATKGYELMKTIEVNA